MPATRRNCNNMAIYSEQQLLQASIISRIFSKSQLQSPCCGSKSVLFYFICLQIPGREFLGPRRARSSCCRCIKFAKLFRWLVLFCSGQKYISHTSPGWPSADCCRWLRRLKFVAVSGPGPGNCWQRATLPQHQPAALRKIY